MTMDGAVDFSFLFDSFVHGRLPYENLKPDPVLRHLLQSLPIRKVIFTNGDKVHAAKVLERLGLEDCFQGIICFETLNPPSSSSEQESAADIFDIVDHFSHPRTGVELPETPILCKPSANAMERALRIAHIDPQRTIFFDDSVRNIQSGKRIGLHTVLVGTSQIIKGADHALESIHNIKEAFPELWEEGDKTEDVHHPGKIALETSVIA
ncbi:Haloacid dehalogenase-like hydrolase family protein [Musa troglodytarum]|uniref:Haloacid dehalogenase-like hydrolase family protein n=1 Tax=Musa troglodytarum TaxID=320322 RepID=A0A9E7HFF5_9LILI|nr:Haloacid dehalogenase-like hydrolase family protein [Musa troglodytarum]